jgi:hypothetical protein
MSGGAFCCVRVGMDMTSESDIEMAEYLSSWIMSTTPSSALLAHTIENGKRAVIVWSYTRMLPGEHVTRQAVASRTLWIVWVWRRHSACF